MGTQYFCSNNKRRQDVSNHATLNGIDYLEVLDTEAVPLSSPRQQTLLVRCFKALPETIDSDNVQILGGVRVTSVGVQWAARADRVTPLFNDGLINIAERDFFTAQPTPENVLVVRTDSYGDYSTYQLCLVTDDAPMAGFDIKMAMVAFSFKVECPSEFDCAADSSCPPDTKTIPAIDYLAKDYASFRQLMLDRLSLLMPEWQDRNPADMGIALVETLAYAADYLSYYQDAVATEAYLGTARNRPSLRRHARLLDYYMHEGCNARTWIALQVDAGVQDALLPLEYVAGQKTQFLTRIPSQATQISAENLPDLLARYHPKIFEPIFPIRLYNAHNSIQFYTWGDEQCCLPKGATKATLRNNEANRLRLCPGDVLIFQEVKGIATGQPADADPTHRHAVRLTRVAPEAVINPDGSRTPGALYSDALYGNPIVEIEWSEEDALPFPLCLSTLVEENFEEVLYEDMSLAMGNVVLVDHGRTVPPETLPPPTGDYQYRPFLTESRITYHDALSTDRWATTDADDPEFVSAFKAVEQQPRQALPDAFLIDGENQNYKPIFDLMDSDRFDFHFVVEVHNDRRAQLRFGDNLFGRTPEEDVPLEAYYRMGNGSEGNVGADAIYHVVTTPGIGITPALPDNQTVRNPLPARGGTDPESLEAVRLYAPQAFRTQARAVTEEDYAWAAQQHAGVSKAIARRLWTGSWHTMFITVDRVGGKPVDQAFEEELTAFISQYQLAGHEVEITPPEFVPLDIAMRVCVEPNYLAADVKLALLETFNSQDLPDGRRGYFHPDNFTFGQPVYLSDIMSQAMEVTGVRWVKMDTAADPPARFQRWGELPRNEIDNGYIDMGRMEIARLDNDPNAPENGKIEFLMEGGI